MTQEMIQEMIKAGSTFGEYIMNRTGCYFLLRNSQSYLLYSHLHMGINCSISFTAPTSQLFEPSTRMQNRYNSDDWKAVIPIIASLPLQQENRILFSITQAR